MFRMAILFSVLAVSSTSAKEARVTDRGEVRFVPTADEINVSDRFRLAEHTFAWEATRLATVTETLEVWDVSFPSPVNTPLACNNTVWCEYYQSRLPGRKPGVIVLHILGGDFELSRLFCNALAQHGVCALFVKMPYYGPRRDSASPRRMVSTNPQETVAGMTQAVLDIRRATAWLAARPEVNDEALGIFGISLGGITSCLAASAEPRLKNVCMLLAGGDVGRVAWESLELRGIREKLLAQGVNREQFVEILRVIDPVTYAPQARGKRILMLNARDDEVIPRACTESLWKALGEPDIHWYSGGHYSAIRHIFSALLRVSNFFASSAAAP